MRLFKPDVQKMLQKQDGTGLIKALNDGDIEIRRSAVHALGRLKDQRAVPALAALVNDADRWLKSAVLDALGETGGAQAISLLRASITADDWEMSWNAIHALEESGHILWTDELLKPWFTVKSILDSARTKLLDQVDPHRDERMRANPVHQDMMKEITGNSWQTEVPAQGAAKIPAPSEEDYLKGNDLLPVVNDPWQPIGNTEIPPFLAAYRFREYVIIRPWMARMLGMLKDHRAVQPLIDSLKDRSGRHAIIQALGELGDPAAAIAIEKTISFVGNAADLTAQENTFTVLEKLGHPVSPSTIARNCVEMAFRFGTIYQESGIYSSLEKAVSFGSDALKPLVEAFHDEDKLRFDNFANALPGALAKVGAVDELLKGLNSDHENIRIHCSHALGSLEDASHVTDLIPLLGESNIHLRNAAIYALGKIGDEEAIIPLLHTLGNKYGSNLDLENMSKLIHGAFKMMCKKHPELLKTLRDALRTQDWRVRAAAAEVLGELEDAGAIKSLEQALADPENWYVEGSASMALKKIRGAMR